mmetsp:Transcript_1562/g.4695  ORF Transcript_1562/g.4695 Transcript_1562/m.4695 type:complete len:189 (-) Transcript_1562:1183-1749(-)
MIAGLEIRLWLLALLLAEFHLSEALLSRIFTPDEFGWVSLLLSGPYAVAMSVGALELWLSAHRERHLWSLVLGLLACVTGEVLRKLARLQAKFAFTHKMKRTRRDGHQLVTSGIYSFCRHPGYLGWFLFFVGTQILVENLVSPFIFLLVGHRFLKVRIRIEDSHLRNMFGDNYLEYRQKTPTRIFGIP